MNDLDFINQDKDLENLLSFNFKKVLLTFWSRRILLSKVFLSILFLFILSTFISTKKYQVDADLYINKSNNTNMAEFNPYFIDEAAGISLNSIADKIMLNEIELMQCPLVIDKVISDNDIRYGKLFGFIPTRKTGKLINTNKFLKKKFKIENKKGTSVVTISYIDKDREAAYNIVNSTILNYIALHKELNSEKSKSDKKIIETEYQKAKADLNKKVNAASGLPTASMSGTGNLAAMSAFSRSAQTAMSSLKGQYLAGEKARVEIGEDAAKVTQLASKLEWANLVEQMSDSSKVIVIKEPILPEDYDQISPKLLINILLGIIIGFISSIIVLIIIEKTDKKLSYSLLDNNIIYNINQEFCTFSSDIIAHSDEKCAFVLFENLSEATYEKFKNFDNITLIKADITKEFKNAIKQNQNVVIFASINKTDSELYKQVKRMITTLNKNIIYEVLI